MAPKTNRKGVKKASKGGDGNEVAEIVKAEAEASAEADGRTYKKRKTSSKKETSEVGGDVGGKSGAGGGGGAAVATLSVAAATYRVCDIWYGKSQQLQLHQGGELLSHTVAVSHQTGRLC